MKGKTLIEFLPKLTLCLMIAILAVGCSSTTTQRSVASKESIGPAFESEFFKHKIDQTMYK